MNAKYQFRRTLAMEKADYTDQQGIVSGQLLENVAASKANRQRIHIRRVGCTDSPPVGAEAGLRNMV
jgi:hypothetical protein